MALAEDLALLELVETWDYRVAGDNRVDDLALLLERVQQARRTLADAEEALARAIYAEVGRGTHTLNEKPVEVFAGQTRTEWNHADLIPAAVKAVADELGYDVGPVEQVVTAWLKVCGTSGWKLTGLRAVGLQPDEYARARPGKPSVRIV